MLKTESEILESKEETTPSAREDRQRLEITASESSLVLYKHCNNS
jgi:hypothetical protein